MSAAVISLLLALGLVFWWRADGGKKAGSAAVGSGPQVTKPYPRERDARERRTKNPREEFEAARERGMTEAEVRGIVEEFVSLGITYENHQDISVEEYVEVGEKARDWYRGSLVEGFSLTPIQELVLIKMLREIGKKDTVQFKERLARFRDYTKKAETGDLGLEAYGFMLEFGGNAALAGSFGLWEAPPQKHIELDDQQRQMLGYHDEKGQWIWVNGGQSTLDYGTDLHYLSLHHPMPTANSIISSAGKIFPLSMGQADRLEPFRQASVSCHWPQVSTGDLLKQAKFLTAPQLRTLLIFHPNSAKQLMLDLGE